MEFECRTVSLTKPMLNEKGVMEPLCNSCTQSECSYNIKKRTVSILGKNVEWHVQVSGNQAYQVVACAGYLD